MGKILKVLCFFAIFTLIPATSYSSLATVGVVKSVTGKVTVTNADNSSSAAYKNMKIFEGDTIKTGASSSVGVLFDDDSAVSFGPNSSMKVQEFMFNPVEKNLSFVARFLHGSFSFISGQLVKLAPEKVRLETPDATLGVRGTKLIITVE